MQAPPFVYKHAAHALDSKQILRKCNNNKMPQWTKEQRQEAIQKVKAKQLPIAARMYGITVSDIFYVHEHVCFSSWLESTQLIVYANVGTRTIGMWLFC